MASLINFWSAIIFWSTSILVIGLAFALRLERTAALVLKGIEGIKNVYCNLQFYGENKRFKKYRKWTI